MVLDFCLTERRCGSGVNFLSKLDPKLANQPGGKSSMHCIQALHDLGLAPFLLHNNADTIYHKVTIRNLI